MITLDLPQEIEAVVINTAQKQGISVNEYFLQLVQSSFDDGQVLFDIDNMKQKLKGFESREEALKNGTPIPSGLDRNELLMWLADERAKRQALA